MSSDDIVVILKKKYVNRRILKELRGILREMFPYRRVTVELGEEENIQVGTNMTRGKTVKLIRRTIITLGGKINRK